MEKIEHREFMVENGLDTESLPEGLQRKIKVFDKLFAKLEETVDDDNERVLSKLNDLDRELVQDLETEFEDQLENNDIDEENDDILENFYKQGNREVLRSELQQAGFKGDLSSEFIITGTYCLERTGTFTFRFKIHKFSKS